MPTKRKRQYEIQVNVEVTDIAELREYAMERAHFAGMSLKEFLSGESPDPNENIEYWLGWAFDAGTPEGCGFEIQDSRTVYEGDV